MRQAPELYSFRTAVRGRQSPHHERGVTPVPGEALHRIHRHLREMRSVQTGRRSARDDKAALSHASVRAACSKAWNSLAGQFYSSRSSPAFEALSARLVLAPIRLRTHIAPLCLDMQDLTKIFPLRTVFPGASGLCRLRRAGSRSPLVQVVRSCRRYSAGSLVEGLIERSVSTHLPYPQIVNGAEEVDGVPGISANSRLSRSSSVVTRVPGRCLPRC